MPWFRCPGRSRWLARMAVASLMTTTSLGSATAAAQTENTELLLSVVVNGRPIDMIGNFVERGGKICSLASELVELGFKARALPPHETDTDCVVLDQIPGVSYRLDRLTQTLFVTAATSALMPVLVGADTADPNSGLKLESAWGVVANYNLVGSTHAGTSAAEGFLETRAFSPYGLVSSSFIGASNNSHNAQSSVRLDTYYSLSDPDLLRRYKAGDLINGGLAWTRPIRMAGLQISTDFSIRPDLVTFPVPTLSGQVAVPSSIDVLVNGVQLLSRDVPAGPFEVRQFPIVSGTGEVSVVVRNAVGQDSVQTLSLTTSTRLLKPGLSAFSAELGAVRLNYAVRSNDYRAPVASFSYRYGLFDWLTLEAHAEAAGRGSAFRGETTEAGGMAGGGASFTMGSLGVISLATAASNFGGRTGTLGSVSFERIARSLSVAGSIQATGAQFGDIAATAGDPVPKLQMRASAGTSLGSFGSLGVAFAAIRRQAQAPARQSAFYNAVPLQSVYGFNVVSLLPATKVMLASASYSRQIFNRRASFYATGFRDLSSARSYGVMAGITIPFGSRSTAGIGTGFDNGQSDTTFQAGRSAASVGDVGWQLRASTGKPQRELAVGEYKSPWGLVDAGIDRTGNQTTFRGTLQGALAYAGGEVFASNLINDSFAVVDTGEVGGVQVFQENRPVGRTGTSGRLIVPDLRSFDANRLAIDPTDMPFEASIGESSRMVRPQDHSGVIVKFTPRFTSGAIVVLVDEMGVPVPVGSSARTASPNGAAAVSVGYDGEAYVTGLQQQNTLIVSLPLGRTCTAAFGYRPQPGVLPRIGPVTCRKTPS